MPKYPVSNPKDRYYYARKVDEIMGAVFVCIASVAILSSLFILA